MENQIEKNIEHLRNSQLFRGFTDDEIEKFLYNTKFKIFELNRGAILNVELDKSIFVLAFCAENSKFKMEQDCSFSINNRCGTLESIKIN